MKHTKILLHLVFTVFAATFLTACSSWQGGGDDSGYSNNSNGHGGHSGHH